MAAMKSRDNAKRTFLKTITVALAMAISSAALAQYQQGQPGQPGYSVPGGSRDTSARREPLTEPGRSFRGEVRSIDKISGTITLRHGPIVALSVREGTTDYPVKDSSMLERVKVGDQVRFSAILQGRSLLVTNIGPAD